MENEDAAAFASAFSKSHDITNTQVKSVLEALANMCLQVFSVCIAS